MVEPRCKHQPVRTLAKVHFDLMAVFGCCSGLLVIVFALWLRCELPGAADADHDFIGTIDIHLLSPAAIAYPLKADEYASQPVPSLKDWQELWAAWDTVTRAMTPQGELLSKPIKLRNDLIFYHGHIPSFAGTSFGQDRLLSNSDTHQIYRLPNLQVESQRSQ